jgi:hypothetical protein
MRPCGRLVERSERERASSGNLEVAMKLVLDNVPMETMVTLSSIPDSWATLTPAVAPRLALANTSIAI